MGPDGFSDATSNRGRAGLWASKTAHSRVRHEIARILQLSSVWAKRAWPKRARGRDGN